MRLIIAGSRDISLQKAIFHINDNIKKFENVDTIISGNAKGVDTAGQLYAELEGIDWEIYPANWKKHHKKAGMIRNIKMASLADGLLAIRKDKSKGTTHMIKIAQEKGLQVVVVDV